LITLVVEPQRFASGDGADEGGPAASGSSGAASAAGERRNAASRPPLPQPLLTVEGDAYRHLFRARRVGVGERLRVVDGEGRARWGEVIQVGRNAALVELAEPAAPNEPRLRLELLVATLRPERASWLVEKATEIGAAAVRFLNTERGPRSFGAGTAERLRRVAIAAVEQCHRARCPEVTGPHPFHEVAALTAGAENRWLLDPAAEAHRFARPSAPPSPLPESPMESLLVGPEGGWSPAELEALEAGSWQPISLGPRILRIETAVLAGASLLLLASGGDGPWQGSR
jgi:16S rRNA (uracil1498-N3)-methyltransferase